MQNAFAEALFGGEGPIPEGLISHNSNRPTKRFAVYRNNVIVSLVEALRHPLGQIHDVVEFDVLAVLLEEFHHPADLGRRRLRHVQVPFHGRMPKGPAGRDASGSRQISR